MPKKKSVAQKNFEYNTSPVTKKEYMDAKKGKRFNFKSVPADKKKEWDEIIKKEKLAKEKQKAASIRSNAKNITPKK